MATLKEQILARLPGALAGITGVQLVARSIKVGIDRDKAPAIVVRPDAESVERISQNTDKHLFEALVIVHTRGDPWDAIADPIVDAAHKAITTDATLTGLAADIRLIAADAEDAEADATAGAYTLRYRFTFLTRATNVSAQPA